MSAHKAHTLTVSVLKVYLLVTLKLDNMLDAILLAENLHMLTGVILSITIPNQIQLTNIVVLEDTILTQLAIMVLGMLCIWTILMLFILTVKPMLGLMMMLLVLKHVVLMEAAIILNFTRLEKIFLNLFFK